MLAYSVTSRQVYPLLLSFIIEIVLKNNIMPWTDTTLLQVGMCAFDHSRHELYISKK